MNFRRHILIYMLLAVCILMIGCSSDDNPVKPKSTIVRVPGDYATIQEAIDAIDSASTGWTVLVADGEYTGEGNRDISFKGKSITVKSVNGAGSTIINCEADSTNPHRAFIFDSGEDSTSRLEGFTIRNGYADEGAAILCYDSPAIANCVFSDNFASVSGGAISILASSSRITSCSFLSNEAHITSASSFGGAVICRISIVTFESCEFMENSAAAGGAIAIGMSTVAFENCDFTGNSAVSSGGAMISVDCDLDITGCSFSGNTAAEGGAADFDASRVSVSNTEFMNNSASLRGGAIRSYLDDVLDISFCLFDGNSSARGGAIDLTGTDPTIGKSTFNGNAATNGSALFCLSSAKPNLQYCILAFGDGIPVVANDLTRPVVSCCDVYGNVGGDFAGSLIGQENLNGNFSLDPLLCDADAGNFRLQYESPCAETNSNCQTLVGAFEAGCVPEPDGE